MRKTENFGGLKLDIKTIFTSDIVRLTIMATLMAMGLYAIQYISILS